MKSTTAGVLLRFGLALLIGMALGGLLSEGSYLLLRDPNAHETAQRFEIVIPNGTAAKIAAGEASPVPLPESMIFVQGDTLAVRNEDVTSHQLGPIWVPPGATGVLVLDKADQFAYTCSFQTTQYLGLDVRPLVTPWMRFQGALAIGLPSGAMLGLYSFLLYPLKKKPSAGLDGVEA